MRDTGLTRSNTFCSGLHKTVQARSSDMFSCEKSDLRINPVTKRISRFAEGARCEVNALKKKSSVPGSGIC